MCECEECAELREENRRLRIRNLELELAAVTRERDQASMGVRKLKDEITQRDSEIITLKAILQKSGNDPAEYARLREALIRISDHDPLQMSFAGLIAHEALKLNRER